MTWTMAWESSIPGEQRGRILRTSDGRNRGRLDPPGIRVGGRRSSGLGLRSPRCRRLCRDFPDLRGPVPTARDEARPVVAEGDAANDALVRAKPLQLTLPSRIPKPQGAIFTARGQEPAIGAERQGPDATAMAGEGVDRLVAPLIPDRDGPLPAPCSNKSGA